MLYLYLPAVPPTRPLPDELLKRYQSPIDKHHDENLQPNQNQNVRPHDDFDRPTSASFSSLSCDSGDTVGNSNAQISRGESLGEIMMDLADQPIPSTSEASLESELSLKIQSDPEDADEHGSAFSYSVTMDVRSQTDISWVKDKGRSMVLHKAVQNVLACQESMYEELVNQLARGHQFAQYGWDSDDDISDLNTREKFMALINRYVS